MLLMNYGDTYLRERKKTTFHKQREKQRQEAFKIGHNPTLVDTLFSQIPQCMGNVEQRQKHDEEKERLGNGQNRGKKTDYLPSRRTQTD